MLTINVDSAVAVCVQAFEKAYPAGAYTTSLSEQNEQADPVYLQLSDSSSLLLCKNCQSDRSPAR